MILMLNFTGLLDLYLINKLFMEILIKKLNDQAKLPAYASEAGPGIDLYSLVGVTIEPGARVVVSTGIAMAVPVGYVGLIWNKNGMVTEEPLKVTGSRIDSGYRDEITVELTNAGSETLSISAGDQIAQILIQQVHRAHLIEAADLSSSGE